MSAEYLVKQLVTVLEKELKNLQKYNAGCEQMHKAVVAKDWPRLERIILSLRKRAEKLGVLDREREELISTLKIHLELAPEASFRLLLSRLPENRKVELELLKRNIRRAVTVLQSRMKGIGNYTESQAAALKEVLEELIPDQKGRIYNSRGTASVAEAKPLLFSRHI